MQRTRLGLPFHTSASPHRPSWKQKLNRARQGASIPRRGNESHHSNEGGRKRKGITLKNSRFGPQKDADEQRRQRRGDASTQEISRRDYISQPRDRCRIASFNSWLMCSGSHPISNAKGRRQNNRARCFIAMEAYSADDDNFDVM